MNNPSNKTIEEFIIAYKNGQRHFTSWDFDEDGSIQGLNLNGVIFEDCFLFLDFRNSNLTNSKFIRCNMKTADFSGANLENAEIKNCSVEATIFKGANVKNVQFENNGYYGITLEQEDFINLISEQ